MPEFNKNNRLGITEDSINDEIVGKDMHGHSRSAGVASIDMQPMVMNKMTGELSAGGDPKTPADEDYFQMEDYSVEIESLDGRMAAVTIMFDDLGRDGLRGLTGLLDSYRALIRKAEKEMADTGRADYPVFDLAFSPYAHKGTSYASFLNPGDYSPAQDAYGNIRGVRMVFDANDVDYGVEEPGPSLTGQSSATAPSGLTSEEVLAKNALLH